MELPRGLQIEFSKAIQSVAEDTGTEIEPEEMWSRFEEVYLPVEHGVVVRRHEISVSDHETRFAGDIEVDGVAHELTSRGSGPIECFVAALGEVTGVSFDVVDYVEHARGEGSRAEAVAYVACRNDAGHVVWGVGIDENVLTASFQAVVRAVGRLVAKDTDK